VIVPITEWKDRYDDVPWIIQLNPDTENGLDKPSAADVFQVRSLSQRRFVRRLGKVSEKEMKEITRALAIVLSIGR